MEIFQQNWQASTVHTPAIKGHPCNDIKVVYLAGKMRGVKHYNHPAFDEHARKYRIFGFTVISPAEIDRDSGLTPYTLPPNWDWSKSSELHAKIVAGCLNQVLNKAHAIFLLPGWETSRGACGEVAVAMWLGKPVFERVEHVENMEEQILVKRKLYAHKLTFEEFVARAYRASCEVSYPTPEPITLTMKAVNPELLEKVIFEHNKNTIFQSGIDIQTTKFSTGAVRSADRAKERYDLISPIGVRRVLEMLDRNSLFVGGIMSSRLPANANQSFILDLLYSYLSGQRDRMEATHFIARDSDEKPDSSHEPHNILALAALCIMVDIAKSEGKIQKIKADTFNAGMTALARTYHEGAVKYSAYNWEKGYPITSVLNHAIAHLLKHDAGDTSEDHLGHALWNVFAAMHSEELWPELNKDLRLPGCKPPVEN